MVTIVIVILISFVPNNIDLPLEGWETLQEKGEEQEKWI